MNTHTHNIVLQPCLVDAHTIHIRARAHTNTLSLTLPLSLNLSLYSCFRSSVHANSCIHHHHSLLAWLVCEKHGPSLKAFRGIRRLRPPPFHGPGRQVEACDGQRPQEGLGKWHYGPIQIAIRILVILSNQDLTFYMRRD